MNIPCTVRWSGPALALLATGVLIAPAAGAAPVERPGALPVPVAKAEDFDGDGYRDVAVAAPHATVEGRARAGSVAVLYGSRKGEPLARKQVFRQGHKEIPGTPGTDDRFGADVVSADLDRDGYADLMIGVPGESGAGKRYAGAVVAVWGGPDGLGSATTVLHGVAEYDSSGAVLAAGDFDGDGDTDVVTTDRRQSGQRLVSGPFGRDGSHAGTVPVPSDQFGVHTDFATGDVNGDGRTDLVTAGHTTHGGAYPRSAFHLGTPLGPGHAMKLGGRPFEADNVDMGDINRDGFADIVLGRQGGLDTDLEVPHSKGGMITWVPGSPSGPVPARARALNQDSPGVPGAAEDSDNFGSGASIGDIDGDRYPDIAVGVASESFGGVNAAGALTVLRGSRTGPTTAGAQVISQSTPGVPGVAEHKDHFGYESTVVDINNDGRSEVFTAAIGENGYAGAVSFLRGTRSGLTGTGAVTFGTGSLGMVATNAMLGEFND
ncbi:FG-GAP and VCBS repeat-containing protein [Streptomyces yaizuensis]|uniref:FG-GAP-like repeat-containing protein n=1 Tax=Streptomyces yaizuensis TaxID=2989713 RepID=A0ABQ5NXS5_9ACTN|nr:VCBS repeat-containing protein [Streptomyces sp. YSPA8]GLF95162.1 FG-GAP-like repeat-containing protein [Streptomyces sp. YSPA8]